MLLNEIFELYKKVQNKDRAAEDALIAEHKKRYPKNWFHVGGYDRSNDPSYRQSLHMMYLHLTK